MSLDTLLKDIFELYTGSGESTSGVMAGLGIELLLLLLIIFAFKKFPKSSFVVLCGFLFEKIYEFFEDILGGKEKVWIKTYITLLFFIILISNLLGVFLEILAPMFEKDMNNIEHVLGHYIQIPTADINFNLAMAIIGVIIMIIEQFKHLGWKHFTYDYFPVLGKGYIPYELGKLPKIIDYPIFLFIKSFDIVISLFLGILEIVGHLAKLISLSFRLFGNVTSGGILLFMLIGAVSALSMSIMDFQFPVIIPLVVYLQEILVALIQALVFPLLIAIFIKVAKVEQG